MDELLTCRIAGHLGGTPYLGSPLATWLLLRLCNIGSKAMAVDLLGCGAQAELIKEVGFV